MIFFSLVWLTLIGLSKTQNLCYYGCQPFHCHGIQPTQCNRCPDNQELWMGACRCKLGYFNSVSGAPCSVYSWDCQQGTVNPDNSVTCTKCFHNRYCWLT